MPDPLLSTVTRMARLIGSAGRFGGLTATQRAALDYLSRANRFSRTPSAATAYLGATRGTVSQTLKALAAKRHLTASIPEGDRRSVSYALTEKGKFALEQEGALAIALADFGPQDRAIASFTLQHLLDGVLRATGAPGFGQCHTCRHHLRGDAGRHCAFHDAGLSEAESHLICHDHARPS
ncbi:MarR family winged helix-turn-helix transcriptional regulator [Ovoidimarina sediminis]|uniref:MarR family winged helix-turn-helix transcriptional regulator n=1 Tax=Ovoidimarina sediminis TaxID=3079856 RepID=UPI00290964D1|nr:MarR family transcriptional regulator [Rhodophyticola sp. MJ-SS7]MDU8944060.1 MarR family transcriptional regulator [Rhodophyticola sp. MJ-SS7]